MDTPSAATAKHQERQEEKKAQRKLTVQSRVTVCLIAMLEVIIREFHHTANAFGNILAGQLKMDSTRIGAHTFMDREELLDFLHNILEPSGLKPSCTILGIAMTRIAAPNDVASLALDSVNKFRKMLFHLPRSHTGNQRNSARFVLGIENIQQPDEVIGAETRPTFDTNRIRDAPHKLDMRTIRLAGTIAKPQKVSTGGVVLAGDGILSAECLLVRE